MLEKHHALMALQHISCLVLRISLYTVCITYHSELELRDLSLVLTITIATITERICEKITQEKQRVIGVSVTK